MQFKQAKKFPYHLFCNQFQDISPFFYYTWIATKTNKNRSPLQFEEKQKSSLKKLSSLKDPFLWKTNPSRRDLEDHPILNKSFCTKFIGITKADGWMDGWVNERSRVYHLKEEVENPVKYLENKRGWLQHFFFLLCSDVIDPIPLRHVETAKT